MNPFTPNPSCEDDGSAAPSFEPAIQFTLKSMALVITALLVGGKTAHRLASMGFAGGAGAGLSMRGEAIFFTIGAAAGAACAVSIYWAWPRLGGRCDLFPARGVKRSLALAFFAVLAGALGGLLIICFLAYWLFAAPKELFDMLTN